ncbi:MAG: septum formation initiator family protein [Muribaculum sp.]|nr:septum formation initiator family protein [Muribaculaceae bacterium]MCM1081212.1 septum formation initiator family protein [Muribaculum sp.]
MKKQLKSFTSWCRRYISVTFLVVMAFVLFVLFFNENSVMHSFELNEQITELELEIQDNEDTLQYYQRLNSALNTDAETLERIVRENYHMQRPNEDVYIVE